MNDSWPYFSSGRSSLSVENTNLNPIFDELPFVLVQIESKVFVGIGFKDQTLISDYLVVGKEKDFVCVGQQNGDIVLSYLGFLTRCADVLAASLQRGL